MICHCGCWLHQQKQSTANSPDPLPGVRNIFLWAHMLRLKVIHSPAEIQNLPVRVWWEEALLGCVLCMAAVGAGVCVCVFASCCPLLHAFPAGRSPPVTSLPQPQYAHHAAEAGEIVSLLPLRHSESHQALLWATRKTSSRLQLSCSGLEHCFCSGTRWMCRSPQAQHLHYHHSSGKRLLYEEDLYRNHGNCSNKCCGNMQRKSA